MERGRITLSGKEYLLRSEGMDSRVALSFADCERILSLRLQGLSADTLHNCVSAHKGLSDPKLLLLSTEISIDSLNVLEIKEVIPIQYMRNRKVVHNYKRIKVEDLTRKGIEDLYSNLNFKKLPSVTELDNFFLIVYVPKPPILVSKINGRLYSLKGLWTSIETQHQASLVLRVFAYVNLVENHSRKSLKRD